jgi:hypothetical protein
MRVLRVNLGKIISYRPTADSGENLAAVSQWLAPKVGKGVFFRARNAHFAEWETGSF